MNINDIYDRLTDSYTNTGRIQAINNIIMDILNSIDIKEENREQLQALIYANIQDTKDLDNKLDQIEKILLNGKGGAKNGG